MIPNKREIISFTTRIFQALAFTPLALFILSVLLLNLALVLFGSLLTLVLSPIFLVVSKLEVLELKAMTRR